MSDMIKDEFGGWMFTEDDRTALADILKAKFDSKQIDNFIVLLQWICFQMKIWQDLPSGHRNFYNCFALQKHPRTLHSTR